MNSKILNLKYYSELSRFINLELQELQDKEIHSNFSLSIVSLSHYLVKPYCFLALKTLLRYSDLIRLNVPDVTHKQRFSVIQRKTMKSVANEFIIFTPQLENYLLKFPDDYFDLPYNFFCTGIDHAKNKFAGSGFFRFNDKTHLFRHLEASFFHSLKIPTSEIAAKLGDEENTIKNYYIHKDIFSNSFLN